MPVTRGKMRIDAKAKFAGAKVMRFAWYRHGGIGTATSNPHNRNHDRKRDISLFLQDRTSDTSDVGSDISVTVMQDPT